MIDRPPLYMYTEDVLGTAKGSYLEHVHGMTEHV